VEVTVYLQNGADLTASGGAEVAGECRTIPSNCVLLAEEWVQEAQDCEGIVSRNWQKRSGPICRGVSYSGPLA